MQPYRATRPARWLHPVMLVLHGAPRQVVVFSRCMYLVVYGLRHAGPTDASPA